MHTGGKRNWWPYTQGNQDILGRTHHRLKGDVQGKVEIDVDGWSYTVVFQDKQGDAQAVATVDGVTEDDNIAGYQENTTTKTKRPVRTIDPPAEDMAESVGSRSDPGWKVIAWGF